MERARALKGSGRALPVEPIQIVAAADDQVTARRMTAALARPGLVAPDTAVAEPERIAARISDPATGTVVAVACDVADADGMTSLRRLRRLAREACIVVVTPAVDATAVRRALDAGADGVVFEADLETTLATCVLAVAAGQAAVPRRVRGGFDKPAFSHRERQVLAHVAAGLTNNEIAGALFLSESTVKSHLSSAFAKLGVHSRKEAAALVLDPDRGLGADLLAAGVPALAGERMRGAP